MNSSLDYLTTLPTELILMIAEFLPTLHDLNSLILTSSHLHQSLISLLYSSAVDTHPGGTATRQRRRERIFKSVIERNNITSLARLLAHDIQRTAKPPRGSWTRGKILGEAITYGTTDAVQVILQQGVSASSRVERSCTALHLAADRRDHAVAVSLITVLLANGADANVGQGDTPLIKASRQGNVKAIQLLLDKGANPNLCRSCQPRAQRITPLEITSCPESAMLLLEFGADARRVRLEKWLEAYRGEEDVMLIRKLVEKGARMKNGMRGKAAVKFWKRLRGKRALAGFGEVERILAGNLATHMVSGDHERETKIFIQPEASRTETGNLSVVESI